MYDIFFKKTRFFFRSFSLRWKRNGKKLKKKSLLSITPLNNHRPVLRLVHDFHIQAFIG